MESSSDEEEFKVAFANLVENSSTKSARRLGPKSKMANTYSKPDIKKKPKPTPVAKNTPKAGPASKMKKNGKVKKKLHPPGLKLIVRAGTDLLFV